MSHVIVDFPERREVFMDDGSEGDNVDGSGQACILIIGTGQHTFRLGGAADYHPPAQTLMVPDAPSTNPFRVVFRKN